jgi:DNA-binding MarR family transcriptional regulator
MTKNVPRRKTATPAAAPQPARSEPTPLALGPLPGYTGYLLRRAQLALFDSFINTFKPLGLRPAQFSVLSVMDANPGRRQSEIAAALGIRQANLVGLIDELDRRGLAKRRRLPADRRSHALTLTAKGSTLLNKALALQARYEQRLVSELGATEHARLITTLTKLHRVLTEVNGAAPIGPAPSRRRARKPDAANDRSRATLQS